MHLDYSRFVFTEDSPWGRCLSSFLRTLIQRSHHTHAMYTGILQQFFARTQKPPDRITRADVEEYIYSKSDKQWCKNPDGTPKVSTSNHRLATISSFYAYSATFEVEGDDGQLHPLLQRPSPTTSIKHGKPERSYQVLSVDELRRFFQCIPRDTVLGKRDFCVFSFYFWTARRRVEIQRLLWKDIQPSPLVPSGYLYRWRGKGNPHLEDAMELPKPAVDALFDYLQFSGRLATIQPHDPLFTALWSTHGGNVKPGEIRQLSQTGITHRLKYYAQRAGIAPISLHTFRHVAAKLRFEAGSDIREIQQLLRHQSLATTDVYLRTLTGMTDPGAKRLEDKYGKFS